MKGDICSIEGCDKTVRTGKVCEIHAWRMRKKGSYDKPSRKRFGDICKVEGCNTPRDGRHSVCGTHRIRWQRYKSFDVPVKEYPPGVFHICKLHGELTKETAYKNPKYGHYSCLPCRKINRKRYLMENPQFDPNESRRHYTIKNGNIKVTKKEYDRMFEEQKGVCKICQEPETRKNPSKNPRTPTKRLAIDHQHGSNKIRGLLCQLCNTSLGGFQDSIELLESAILYLKSHE